MSKNSSLLLLLILGVRLRMGGGQGTGDRNNVSAGCTGMEAHGRLGCH